MIRRRSRERSEAIERGKPQSDINDEPEIPSREQAWERIFRNAGMEVPTTIAAACFRIDQLKNENAQLRNQLDTARNKSYEDSARADWKRMAP